MASNSLRTKPVSCTSAIKENYILNHHFSFFLNNHLLPVIIAIKHLPLLCARHCTDQSNSQFIRLLGLSGTFFSKTALPPSGIVTHT